MRARLDSYAESMGAEETTVPGADVVRAAQSSRIGLLWVFPDSFQTGSPRFTEIGAPAVVGRGAGVEISLEVSQVSRRHVRLTPHFPLLVAEDLGSRNGTFHDGRRIEKSVLEPGALLRLGEAIAIVYAARPDEAFDYRELAPGVFGGATLSRRLRELPCVAASDLPVIVVGRTGAGKEGVARAVHHYSGRRGKLIAINCASVPEPLAEAQLFGHKRGAFTGAESSELGFIAAADGGTLFLDEILELAPSIQARLLRVLQEREYTPLGETRAVKVDLRVVVASQEPLEQAVRAGRFREDLYARLNGYQIDLQTLRERKEDIAPLFRHFLAQRFEGRPPSASARLIESLCLYEWPRNVRELETVARRMATLHGQRAELDLPQLEGAFGANDARLAGAASDDTTSDETRGELEPAPSALLAALDRHRGNVAQAAKQLGISRARAYRLMVALGVDAQRYRRRSLGPA
jgi:DNA-binding NtrC family response regulator